MNKKQLICMWCGILSIVFFGFFTILEPYRPDYANFCVWVFLVTLITGGLILTFKDKKRPEGETRKPMNLRRGFRRITLLLAIVVAIICACIAVERITWKYSYVERGLRLFPNHISESEESFWATLSKESLVGLCALAGIVAAVAGFCGVWTGYFVVRLVNKIIKWLILGFRVDT